MITLDFCEEDGACIEGTVTPTNLTSSLNRYENHIVLLDTHKSMQ